MMAVQSSKELVRGLFQFRDLSRIPFMPWVGRFAAQLEQIDVEEMLCDAGALSRALINAQKVFGYDAISTVIDPSLEAEACGGSIEWGGPGDLPVITGHPLAGAKDLDVTGFEKRGRVPVVLEAVRRIHTIKGKEVAVVGMVTGPLTLARQLGGDAFLSDCTQDSAKTIAVAGSVALKLARLYCEAGADVIAIADEALSQIEPTQYQLVAAPLRSIWNVVHFYSAHSLLIIRGCPSEHVEPLLALGADGVVISGDLDYAELAKGASAHKTCWARPVPESALLEGASSPADLLATRGKGFFLSTEWDVPCEASVDRMNEVMRAIGDLQHS
jgi:uroporphyrinogen-III decarboxylase